MAAEWARDFVESRALTCQPTTLATYRQCVEAFAHWLDDRSIDARLIGAYLTDLKARCALETVRNHRRMLKTLCRWLMEVGQLDHDPFSGPGKVPAIPRKRVRRRTYTEAEIVRLLRASGPVQWKLERVTTRKQWQPGGPLEREAAQQRALVLLLIDSALRAGEVARLTCGQVRAEELVVVGKGGHQDVVYIEPQTRAALLAICADRPDGDPVFRDWNGRAPTPRTLRSLLERLARRAGVEPPPRPLHAFRHYAGRQWQKAGLADLTIQQLMRHADIRTTQIYTGLDSEDLRAEHARVSPLRRLLASADAG